MSEFLRKASKFFLGPGKKKRKSKEGEDCPPADRPAEEEEIKMEEEKQEINPKDRSKLFVGGLSSATTTKNLENYFSRYGKVVDAVVKRFLDSSKSRGFGFVTFVDSASAEAALKAVHVLDDKIVDVRPFRTKGQLPKSNKERVFLGGVPSTMTESDLKDFFTRYGEVVDVVIPLDRDTKTPKGYAFVSFKEQEAAEKCLAENFVYFGGKRVFVKKAEPKDGSKTKTNDGSCASDPYSEEDRVCDLQLTDEAAFLDNDETKSTFSEGKLSLLEQFPSFRQIFADYFLGELGICNGVKEERSEEVGEDVKLQKLLEEFCISAPGNAGTTGEDLIDFSEGETMSDSDAGSTTTTTTTTTTEEEEEEEDDDDDDDQESEYSERSDHELRERLVELLSNQITSSKTHFKSSPKGEEEREFLGNSSTGFENKTPLTCLLCQWRPSDDSRESFLAHCQSAAHRQKLRERFAGNENQEIKTEAKVFLGSQSAKEAESYEITAIKEDDSGKQKRRRRKKQPGSEQAQQQGQKKKTPQAGKQKEKPPTNSQQAKQSNQRKGQQKQLKNKNSSKKTEEKNPGNKQEGRKFPNLKVEALARGMVSIRPLSEDKLQCEMCKKIIPKAGDFMTLMRNVSQHLQSKMHLNKLSLTENSLKNALEVSASKEKGLGEKKTTKKVGKENSSVEKANEKVASGKMGPAQKKQNCGDEKKTSKGKEPGADLKKEKGEKKAAKGSAGPQIVPSYACLYCNFHARKCEFNNHLKSKSHSENLRSRGVSSDKFTESSSTCNVCKCVLFGSLIDINQHYRGCLH